jgi:predicted metal-dependent HD superfamily phosphohydrolase
LKGKRVPPYGFLGTDVFSNMICSNKELWKECWQRIGATGDLERWYDRLVAAYWEPQRHYHNLHHIEDCQTEFDRVRHLVREPEAMELALWFHDAVYDPKASDNEERSADLAEACLVEVGVSKSFVESVRKLIMVTKRHDAEPGSDEAVMVDVDLSILGQEEERFWLYEEQIRREYEWVPAEIFAAKRAEILERFLTRKWIFNTEFFRQKYEHKARRNLEASIKSLRREPPRERSNRGSHGFHG